MLAAMVDHVSQVIEMRAQRWKHIMPEWANNFYCNEARALVWLRNAVTGIEWELDHVVPVAGRAVCGLHVETNLQVIPRILNGQKSNKHSRRFAWSEFFKC